jgi:hypothetical protein
MSKHYRMNSEGITLRGHWFVIQRPDGRQGTRLFGSAFRAAEHAMHAYKVPHWSLLRDRGFTVVSIA